MKNTPSIERRKRAADDQGSERESPLLLSPLQNGKGPLGTFTIFLAKNIKIPAFL